MARKRHWRFVGVAAVGVLALAWVAVTRWLLVGPSWETPPASHVRLFMYVGASGLFLIACLSWLSLLVEGRIDRALRVTAHEARRRFGLPTPGDDE
jgi:hypothetical protein